MAVDAAVFVRLKLAGVATPATVAFTVKLPATAFAVNAGAVAIPLALVTAVAVADPPNLPLAPLAGAVNVTVTPLNGLLPASFTVACSAVPYAVLTTALCGVPAVAAMLAAEPVVLFRMKLAGVATPATVAVTVKPPATAFAVNAGAVAIPLALVTAVAVADPPKAPLAPLPGAVNVTVAPINGLLLASFTVACSAVAYTLLTTALCGVPPVAAMLPADAEVFVRLKLAGVATPATVADTVKLPATTFAVNAGAVAVPLALVTAVAVADPPNLPLAPLAGAVNVTVTPLNGLLLASFTVACSAVPYAVLTTALCGVPAVAAMLAAEPAVLVRLKLAGVVTPATVAITVKLPADAFAVNAGAVATPLALVTAVAVAEAPNLPLAPLPGAVNVTVTPLNGLLLASFTVACSAVAYTLLIAALCGVPAVAVMLAAEPPLLVAPIIDTARADQFSELLDRI